MPRHFRVDHTIDADEQPAALGLVDLGQKLEFGRIQGAEVEDVMVGGSRHEFPVQ